MKRVILLIILYLYSCEQVQQGNGYIKNFEQDQSSERDISDQVYLNIEPSKIVFDGKAGINQYLTESIFLIRTGVDDLKVYDIYLKSDDPTNPNIDAINTQLKNCDRIKAGLPEVITTNDLRDCPVMLYQYNHNSALPMIVSADQFNTSGEEIAVIYRNYQDMPQIPANLQLMIETNISNLPLQIVGIKFQSTPAQIKVDNTTVTFKKGQASSKNIMISNLGGEDLKITNITVNQTSLFDGTKEFDVTSTSGSDILATIPPMGSSFYLTVRYTPQTDEIDHGEILIESTDLLNSPVIVTLISEP